MAKFHRGVMARRDTALTSDEVAFDGKFFMKYNDDKWYSLGRVTTQQSQDSLRLWLV
jgi:hypothetical protein